MSRREEELPAAHEPAAEDARAHDEPPAEPPSAEADAAADGSAAHAPAADGGECVQGGSPGSADLGQHSARLADAPAERSAKAGGARGEGARTPAEAPAAAGPEPPIGGTPAVAAAAADGEAAAPAAAAPAAALARPKEAVSDPLLVREYVTQAVDEKVNAAASALLSALLRFQDKLHAADPVKARTKRRLVVGLREAVRSLRTGKARCVVVAHNVEQIEAEGALDDMILDILKLARLKYNPMIEKHPEIQLERADPIPVIFAHTRRTLSKTLKRAPKSSVVAVLNFDGANLEFKELVRLAQERHVQWRQWAALPAQQQAARAYEAQLRASLGEELFARRARLQQLSIGDRVFHAPRSLVLEPKRPAPARGQVDKSSATTARRNVDPVLLELGLLDR
ncbi:hypothetical protein T492DRAFT_590062 [Pavlovales sp. CCMP2436]|nr:hypothetical protein T492DRAFT_590062 [Pavlovales sp. CCMP2436]